MPFVASLVVVGGVLLGLVGFVVWAGRQLFDHTPRWGLRTTTSHNAHRIANAALRCCPTHGEQNLDDIVLIGKEQSCPFCFKALVATTPTIESMCA